MIDRSKQLNLDKSALEIAKLHEEVAALKRPFWKDPARIGAVIVFLASLVGNIFQAVNSRAELEQKDRNTRAELAQKDRDFNFRFQQWEEQRKTLEYQNEDLKNKIASGGISIGAQKKAAAELDSVFQDINTWNAAILKDKTNLTLMEVQLETYKFEKNNIMVKTEEENIEIQKAMIAEKQKKLDAAIVRRSELEKLTDN
jgi:hypothetical protein